MLNLPDIYNPFHIKIFTTICNVLSLINILLCILVLPIIITKTLKSMRTYKRILISYVIAQMGFDIFSLLLKHTLLSPLNAVITVGFLQSYANPWISCIAFNGFLTSIMILGDLLLCLFIERYYSITNMIVSHGKYKQISLYCSIVVTHLFLVFNGFSSFYLFGHMKSSDNAIEFMLHKIDDPMSLLQQQIPFITDLYSNISFSTIVTIFSFMIYFGSRGIGFLYFTYQNIKCLKFVQQHTNSSIQRHHAIIIKTLLIQLFMMAIFFGIPAVIGAAIMTLRLPYPLLYLYIQCNYHIYPIFDLIVTIVMIKPYRRTLTKFIKTTFSILIGQRCDVSPTVLKSAFE